MPRTLASPPQPPPLTLEYIARRFDWALAKGKAYARQGRAHVERHDAHHVEGRVQGTKRYKTQVNWAISGGRWRLESHCSCPLVADCKHVVALALAWLALDAQARARQAVASRDLSAAPVPPDVALAPKPPAPAPTRSAQAIVAAPLRTNHPVAAPAPVEDPWSRWEAADAAPAAAPDGSRAAEQLLYLFHYVPAARALAVTAAVCRPLKSGLLGGLRPLVFDDYAMLGRLRRMPAGHAPWLLALDSQRTVHIDRHPAQIVGPRFEAVLADVLACGAARWREPNGPVLRLGPDQPLQLEWSLDAAGVQQLQPRLDAGTWACGTTWSWYVAPDRAEVGRLVSVLSPEHRALLAELPPVRPEHQASARRALATRLPPDALPAFATLAVEPAAAESLRAVVELSPLHRGAAHDFLPDGCAAALRFRYDGATIGAADRDPYVRHRTGDTVRLIARRPDFEQRSAAFLRDEGFLPLFGGIYTEPERASRYAHPAARYSTTAVRDWVEGLVARGAALDIEFEASDDFPIVLGADAGAPELTFEPGVDGWFEARLGLVVDGERIDLLPVLLGLGRDAERARIEGLRVKLPSGRPVRLSPARLGPILDLLEDLERRGDKVGAPPAVLAGFQPPADWRFTASAGLAAFLAELRQFEGLAPLDPPADFGATLRPYQRLGVAWLDFLRRYRFGGVLADDMGLGKTVQCLAYIARERAAGRWQRPALVVCPTSVAPNWAAEAARLLPSLRVQMLSSGDRRAALADLPQFDLVITSYALLLRDVEALSQIEWGLLVFDEAQWLKNAASKGFRAACGLRAAQRLCMTGTPVENHLGELKAQMDLVMPGLLGDDRRFVRRFRNPIERAQDAAAEATLRARVRPFLLRRTKGEVALDLPPRTVIVQSVQFEAAQQDLYETLRAQMERRVRDALARRGLAQSRITVLDALLKLRQVCCDPSLVDLPAARKVAASAKREALGALLPTLIDDGRSVLLFSQFTSMLDLLEKDLQAADIDYERLDGSTRDRAAPVRRFQRGEVPVFLISLKAGGVGLNLTRADTVILYDPWWNPAVEAQAIDRAHRIGQDKPVFVYELQCVGTVEEKMAQLKQRKRAIADAVLSDGESAIGKLDAAALLALFEPVADPGRPPAPKPSKGSARRSD